MDYCKNLIAIFSVKTPRQFYTSCCILCIRRRSIGLKLTLQKQVITVIDSPDFCILDLTPAEDLIHTDSAGIENALRATLVADFYLLEVVEADQPGWFIHVITRTLGGAITAHYIVNQVRGRGPKLWRNLESPVKFIRSVCPKNIKPLGVQIVFKKSSGA